ncbi:MAG: nucleotide sugar dehydrogenase [Thaumarchaeota archaeon]|nr:nucleotide sugar dehydrogenase [Nitrososphaerota archaeon]
MSTVASQKVGATLTDKSDASISADKLKITVCGLGFVGSSVAAVWLRAGANVIGFDKDHHVVTLAKKGTTHTGEPGVAEAFKAGLKSKRFWATTSPEEAYTGRRVKILTVPVGLRKDKADLTILYSAVDSVARHLKASDIVVVKPTVPIGTSRNLLIPRLERTSGLKAEKDFYYVYSPERISSGQAIADIEDHYPAVVSGVGPMSLDAGRMLYGLIAKKEVLKMSSMEAAEAEKVFEGVYRDVNIALANELAKVCMAAGVNFWEAREAANSQPFSHLHKPGIGVGGACIPVYPHFLIEVADRVGETAALTKLARKINTEMPAYSLGLALGSVAKTGEKAAVLGLAFRGNVPDKRLSPTYEVVRELLRRGMSVWVHDPLIKKDSDLPTQVTLTDNLREAVENSSVVVVCTDHSPYRKLSGTLVTGLAGKGAVILDGRGILDPDRFDGVTLITIGVGGKPGSARE